jgi:hypothetical protein
MNGNKGLAKGRSIVVLLLVVLMLALAATPALAWTPVDEVDGQLLHACRVVSDVSEFTIHYFGTGQAHSLAEKPLVRPNIARAEIMSVAAPQVAQISTE